MSKKSRRKSGNPRRPSSKPKGAKTKYYIGGGRF